MDQNTFGKLSVLIVDDDPFILDATEMALEGIGIKNVKKTTNVKDALMIVGDEGRELDVILCDLYMPDADGLEFLDRLGEMSFSGGVGVISGAEDVILEVAGKLGEIRGLKILGVVKKPITSTALKDLIGTLSE